MGRDATARAELADFLRTRRQSVDPASVGLPQSGGVRRVPGLRREELCLLSGVGLTWYTWLEQGRDINPSRQVLDALGRTLALTPAELEYVRELAGHPSAREETAGELPVHGQRVLDALGSAPAYAITRDWSIVGWNAAYARFFAGISELAPQDRNLLWLLWTDDSVRSLVADWENDSKRFLATFRAEVGLHLHEDRIRGLIERLKAASPDFARAWTSHDVDRFTSRDRHFNHPLVGRLTLEHHQLVLADCPSLNLVVYTAPAGSDAEQALGRLAGA